MLRILLLISIAITLVSGFAVHAQGTSSPLTADAQKSVEKLVRLHEAWGPKASSPGASLVLKETTRSGPIVKYRMMVAGLPKDRVYTLVSWPVTQKGPVENIKGVTLDVTGLAVCAGTPGTCGSPDQPNDPIDILVQPIAGEPSRFGLVSADQTNRVFAKVVPIPLRGEDKGCSVDAILLTPGSELVLVVGSGFPANTELTMDTNSEGEHHGDKGKADAMAAM